MVRIYRSKKNFWFLKAGLFVVENVNGDFYIPMRDQEIIDCPIQLNSLRIDGNAVRADSDNFEPVASFPDYQSYLERIEEFKNTF